MLKNKELGLKIASKEEAFWIKVRDTAETILEESKNTILLQTKVIELAKKEIKLSK